MFQDKTVLSIKTFIPINITLLQPIEQSEVYALCTINDLTVVRFSQSPQTLVRQSTNYVPI